MTAYLRAAWTYRNFIVSAIKSEIIGRFVRSRLGFLWLILNPLAQVAIYALVLSKVLSAKLPGASGGYTYVIYLMAGMLAWSLFTEIVTRSLTMFISNANYMKKIVFPRICIPLVVLGNTLINNVLLFVAIIAVFVLLGYLPGINLLWLPLLTLINLLFALSIGMILGAVNVFVRDVEQFMSVVLQFWFWLTPIVYSASVIPASYLRWMQLNPMYWLVIGYQNALVFNRSPLTTHLGVVAGVSVVLLVFALFLFRRASAEMIDVL